MFAYLASGVVLGLTAGIAPGPLLTLVVSQSLRFGTWEGIKVAMAPCMTDLPIVLASLWFVSLLSARSWPLGILSILGAGYIGYLAWESCTIKAAESDIPQASPDSIKKGILVNLLNPHPYLFWFTVGAPMLIRSWHTGAWRAVLWLTGFYSMLVGSKILLAVVAGKARAWLAGRSYLWIHRMLGLLLFFFALAIAREGLQLLGILH